MTALVGLGSHDRRYEEPEIVTAGNELVGDVVERLGMARWIVVAEVIHRVDEASTDQFRPDAVDDGAGEETVARIGDMLGQLLAQLAGSIHIAFEVDFLDIRSGFIGDIERIGRVRARFWDRRSGHLRWCRPWKPLLWPRRRDDRAVL